MRTKLSPLALPLLLISACGAEPVLTAGDVQATAARLVTQRYARSRLAELNLRATAAGRDCDVLLIETAIPLDDRMAGELHYGVMPYDVLVGGVEHFRREQSFRGVAWFDGAHNIWPFGNVSEEEAKTLPKCH